MFLKIATKMSKSAIKSGIKFQFSTAAAMDKKLFTPGPLGTSGTVKKAMLRDLGSRDVEFINTVKYIREQLLHIAGVSSTKFTAIPLQGSGTYAIEGVLQTATPRIGGKVLVIANGAYGMRMHKICEVANIPVHMLWFRDDRMVDLNEIEDHMKCHSYSVVACVHSETSSGVLNPVESIGQLVKKYCVDAEFFVDAMSSFGAIPLEIENVGATYVVSSANKCLEGVPGFSFAIAAKDSLNKSKGNSRSISLDLYDQYKGLESCGQFRFTPPTHTILAFKQALEEFIAEGGVTARGKRYQENNKLLREGMKKLGFKELVPSDHTGFIITSFHYPNDPQFKFSTFYSKLNELDQVIYPGKLTQADCFRIGNIGHIFPQDIAHLLKCIKKVCKEMFISIPVT
uniref:Alanine--glyoxylate aminotransferase n=1 Tax=Strigamia maritima TaxID=126957 RepID=T1JE68_STRMM